MDLAVFSGLSLLPIILIIYYFKLQSKRHRLPRAPSIWLPFFGNALHSLKSENESKLLHDQRKFGSDAITMWNFSQRRYHFVVTNLELAKECFIKNSGKSSTRINLQKKVVVMFKDEKDYGIIGANGTTWRNHRRTVMTSLKNLGMGKSKLEDMIEQEARQLIEAMEEVYLKSTVHPKRLFATATTSIICQMAFGICFNYNDSSFRIFFEAIENLFAEEEVNLTRFLPSFLHRLLGIYDAKVKRMFDSFNIIRGFCRKQLEMKKKLMKSEHYVPEAIEDCVLERLVQKQNDEPEYYSDTAIIQIIQNLFTAGTETTSNSLSWSILFLMNHSDIQKILRKEILGAIGEGRFTYQHLDSMPHLNAFILETLRFSSVAMRSIIRRLIEPIKTEKYTFPAGSIMQVSLFCIQRDRSAFKFPDRFDINNFLENGRVVQNENLLPFSLGPRACPADRLAKMEIFFFLVHIIRTFNIESIPGELYQDDDALQWHTRQPPQYQVKMTPV